MEWQLVPKEPTQEMLLAYATAWNHYKIRGLTVGQIAAHEYRAMLAAAPKVPQELVGALVTEAASTMKDDVPTKDDRSTYNDQAQYLR